MNRRVHPERRGSEAVASALWLGHERRGGHDRQAAAAPAPTEAITPSPAPMSARDEAALVLEVLERTCAQLDRTRRALDLFVASISRIPPGERPATRLPTFEDARALEARAAAAQEAEARAAEDARPDVGWATTTATAGPRTTGERPVAAAPTARAAHLWGPGAAGMVERGRASA